MNPLKLNIADQAELKTQWLPSICWYHKGCLVFNNWARRYWKCHPIKGMLLPWVIQRFKDGKRKLKVWKILKQKKSSEKRRKRGMHGEILKAWKRQYDIWRSGCWKWQRRSVARVFLVCFAPSAFLDLSESFFCQFIIVNCVRFVGESIVHLSSVCLAEWRLNLSCCLYPNRNSAYKSSILQRYSNWGYI